MSFVGKWFGFGRNPHYDDGVRAYERGDFAEAVEMFKICISSDPEVATRDRAKNYLAGSLGKLAHQCLSDGNVEGAVRLLSEAVKVRPRFADLRRAYAYSLARDGKFLEAKAEIEEALAINPRYGQALAVSGALLIQSGQAAKGLEEAKKAATEDARLIRSTLRDAENAVASGDETKAYKLLFEWPLDPEDRFEADLAEADSAMKKRRFADAEQKYRQLIERRPRYADLRVKHGQSLLEIEQLSEAESEFREALVLNEKFSEAFALLGISLRRQGEEDQAKRAFRKSLEVDPNNEIATAELMRLRA